MVDSYRYRAPRMLLSLLSYVLLVVGGIVSLVPFVWMVATSFKPTGEVYNLDLFPRQATIEQYALVLRDVPLVKWYVNTAIVSAINVVSVAVFSAIAGFGFAKYRFLGQGVLFLMILSTLMVPQEMLLIPWYIASVRLNWVDTYAGLAFPGLASASAVFIMRQFMQSIPEELMDAARLDGVSEPGLLWRIMLPLTLPALAAVCVFTFMGSWNAYLWPLIVVNEKAMYMLQVGLAWYASAGDQVGFGHWPSIMALSTLISIPALIAFLLLNRQIVRGIVLSGIKG